MTRRYPLDCPSHLTPRFCGVAHPRPQKSLVSLFVGNRNIPLFSQPHFPSDKKPATICAPVCPISLATPQFNLPVHAILRSEQKVRGPKPLDNFVPDRLLHLGIPGFHFITTIRALVRVPFSHISDLARYPIESNHPFLFHWPGQRRASGAATCRRVHPACWAVPFLYGCICISR